MKLIDNGNDNGLRLESVFRFVHELFLAILSKILLSSRDIRSVHFTLSNGVK